MTSTPSAGEVEEQDAPRQAGKDVVAEEAAQRHRQPGQESRRKPQRPLSSGRRLLDLGFNGHRQVGPRRNLRLAEPVSDPVQRFDHLEIVVDGLNFLRRRLMWLSMVRSST